MHGKHALEHAQKHALEACVGVRYGSDKSSAEKLNRRDLKRAEHTRTARAQQKVVGARAQQKSSAHEFNKRAQRKSSAHGLREYHLNTKIGTWRGMGATHGT